MILLNIWFENCCRFTAEDMIAVFVRMFYQQQVPETFAYNLITYCTDEDMTDHGALAEVCFTLLSYIIFSEISLHILMQSAIWVYTLKDVSAVYYV